jgi:hypothetical protein
MKDGIDGDGILARLVENLERETPDKRPPELIHYRWVKMRMTLDAKNARLDAT